MRGRLDEGARRGEGGDEGGRGGELSRRGEGDDRPARRAHVLLCTRMGSASEPRCQEKVEVDASAPMKATSAISVDPTTASPLTTRERTDTTATVPAPPRDPLQLPSQAAPNSIPPPHFGMAHI